jgi:hypothetical protein
MRSSTNVERLRQALREAVPSHRQPARLGLKAFGRWFVTGRDPELSATEPRAPLRLQLASRPKPRATSERRSRAERAVETHWPASVRAADVLAVSRRTAGGTRP